MSIDPVARDRRCVGHQFRIFLRGGIVKNAGYRRNRSLECGMRGYIPDYVPIMNNMSTVISNTVNILSA